MRKIISVFLSLLLPSLALSQRPYDMGIHIGVLERGPLNAITDVAEVSVGHYTLIRGDSVRTGVTAILPHQGNIFQDKVAAAIYIGNGFGKLAGYSQVEELGNLETPIILTNTLSVPTAADALIDYTLSFPENQQIRSVNPVVGETNDGRLNDIRGRHITKVHVREALQNASSGAVEEGSVGAGAGTICFGFKGGIGTASRKLPPALGGYSIGVLVQSNFGGVLQIDGVPVGEELGQYAFKKSLDTENGDGSCMIIVATDAPLGSRNLKRLAKRAMIGLGKTGGIASNGSGDYVIAFSTHPDSRVSYVSEGLLTQKRLRNEDMSILFMAAIEATEEAIINSLFAATLEGQSTYADRLPLLPKKKVLDILKKYNRLED
ncbi:MAG: P1 family peptidase [Bacteroidota bacterium]